MKKESIRVVEINTTAYSEENFYLLTNLTDEQIKRVITPIVDEERNDGETYDNEGLVGALNEAYPKNVAYYYQYFDELKF